MKIFRIRDWEKHYENNRTRELKTMTWVSMPTKQGYGYQLMISQKGENATNPLLGPAIYGTFCAIVGIASKCGDSDQPAGSCVFTAASRENPAGRCTGGRGVLIRSSGTPHTVESLAVVTQLPRDLVQAALDFCSAQGPYLGNGMDWIEIIEFDENSPSTAVVPQEPAAISQAPAGFPHLARARGGMEGNGTTGPGTEKKDHKDQEGPALLEELKKKFNAARKAYPEPARGLETEWKEFQKNVSDWRIAAPYILAAIEFQILRRRDKAGRKEFVPAWPDFSKYLATRKWEASLGKAVEKWNEQHSDRPEMILQPPDLVFGNK